MTVKEGDTVQVEYTGTLEDGSEFDSSKKHGQPLEFKVGAKQMIPGFEQAVIGMEVNEEKKITLTADQAYGQPNPNLVKQVPKEQLPKDQEVKVGMMLGVGLPDGTQLPAHVTKVTADTVTIDLNHPLAGKTLHFAIKVVKIN